MARSLCVLVTDAPYGTLQPGEAIRHARGALAKGWEVVLAFTGDSVYTLLPGQSPPPGEWVGLSEAMADLIDDGQERATVLADDRALEARGLSAGDLIPGVRPAPLDEIARATAHCERALIF